MNVAHHAVPELTESDLLAMGFKDLMALFGKLPAPTVKEMDGEFAARLLAQPSAMAHLIGTLTVNNPLTPGHWLCKAFKPLSAERGQGYNTFAHFGRTVQRFPMQTLIAPSRYDGRPAYTLVYASFRSLCGAIHMVDEVRQVGPDLYLGIGTWGFTDRQRRIPLPFVLRGPIAPYIGHIGLAKKGFDVHQEIPAFRKKGSML
ncbi:MAG: hypothetical protein EPO09_05110 [Aquabacterium sp.]|uniref:hypothetical protein n=1 Tax=Aquabacterium sp. TaxID=1872578 RepID=UPI0011FFA6F1|nr:hypothetical protein [Aquabacterium sp.]TAK96945.1 MAG: hypothetical protein EPO09_05110 [Aquabacterium sp.]